MVAVPPNKIVMKVCENVILELYVILLQRSRKTSSVQIYVFPVRESGNKS